MPVLSKDFYPSNDGYVWKFYDSECENDIYVTYQNDTLIKTALYNEGVGLYSIMRGWAEFDITLPYRCHIIGVSLFLTVHTIEIYDTFDYDITHYETSNVGVAGLTVYERIADGPQFDSISVNDISPAVDDEVQFDGNSNMIVHLKEHRTKLYLGMMFPVVLTGSSNPLWWYSKTSSTKKPKLTVYYTRGRHLGG